MSPLVWVISIATLLITPLITTHEPPSIKYSRQRSIWQVLRMVYRID